MAISLIRENNQQGMEQGVKAVLLLGGTNFMGRALLFQLAERERTVVACVNRGNSYWGDHHLQLESGGKVKFFRGDRKVHESFTEALKEAEDWANSRWKEGETTGDFKWSVVVDFSAYSPADVEVVVPRLQSKCSLYVYISTDSVYEVCDPEQWKLRAVREEDAVRCVDPVLQAKRSALDQYGELKFQIEEKLQSLDEQIDFPFVCLRLPDVIGPHDVSDRFWAYMLWIRSGYPVQVQRNSFDNKLSFVYSKDIVALVLRLLQHDSQTLKSLHREAFNLCIPQPTTLFDLLVSIAGTVAQMDPHNPGLPTPPLQEHIAKCSEYHPSGFRYLHTDHLDRIGRFFYPSVTCGPIDPSKAVTHPVLAWNSSSWDTVVKETTQFFWNEGPLFPSEFADVSNLIQEIVHEYYTPKQEVSQSQSPANN